MPQKHALTCISSLQHSPVYTVGKRGTEADFKVSPDQLRQQGIDIYHIPRGGETTFHGPGQLVLYPIINLRRLRRGARRYVEGLEDIMIRTCGAYGICARVRERSPGAEGCLRQPLSRGHHSCLWHLCEWAQLLCKGHMLGLTSILQAALCLAGLRAVGICARWRGMANLSASI